MLSLELCRHVPLIFSCPADNVLIPDSQPRNYYCIQVLLGMVEARSVNVKNTHTLTHKHITAQSGPVILVILCHSH